MTTLLALDTATEACSVALWLDGQSVERFELLRRGHSQRILPMIEQVLAEAGLALGQCDAVAFGRGPGSFTGVRIGVGVAQGLAYGVDIPVVAVSSLAAVAERQPAQRTLAAFDARLGQLYWGCYTRNASGGMVLAGRESVSTPAEVRLGPGRAWLGAGSGWDRYHDVLGALLDERLEGWVPEQYPRAAEVAAIGARLLAAGQAEPAQAAAPHYLRDDVAARPSPRGKP